MTTETLTIVPRVDKSAGAPVLFLVNAPARAGHILSYSHVGQHREASLSYYRDCTRPADGDECATLLREYSDLPGDARLIVRRQINHALLRKQWR